MLRLYHQIRNKLRSNKAKLSENLDQTKGLLEHSNITAIEDVSVLGIHTLCTALPLFVPIL